MADVGVGLVGYKFMGRAHSNAYRQVARFFEVDPAPRMVALCGRDEAATQAAAEQLGWEHAETDYRKLVERSDIDLVDVSTPGYTHRDVVMAALEAGCSAPGPFHSFVKRPSPYSAATAGRTMPLTSAFRWFRLS